MAIGSCIRAQVFGVSLTSTPSGNWVNQARFGFSNFWQKFRPWVRSTNPLTTYGLNTGVTNPLNFGLQEIDINGFTSLGNISGWPLFTTPNRTYQFSDGVSYTRGSHTFKFGAKFRRGSTDNIRDRAGKGQINLSRRRYAELSGRPINRPYNRGALEDFLAGFPAFHRKNLCGRFRTARCICGHRRPKWRMTGA